MLGDARLNTALWRYGYNGVRPHSSLGNNKPLIARRALEKFEGSAPGSRALYMIGPTGIQNYQSLSALATGYTKCHSSANQFYTKL